MKVSHIVDLIGIISRNLFILLSGYVLCIQFTSYDSSLSTKKDLLYERLKKCIEILFFGILLSLFTQTFYPLCYIHFGVLHFFSFAIAITTVYITYLGVHNIHWLALWVILINQFKLFLSNYYSIHTLYLGQYIDIIFSMKSIHSLPMLDYFSLLEWMPIFLLGGVIHNLFHSKILMQLNTNDLLKWMNQEIDYLTIIGRNTLLLTFSHMILFFIIFDFDRIFGQINK